MNISSRYLIAGRLGLLAGLYCLGASTAVADDTMPEMVVTATRTAQTADATLAPVTVITRQEIERRQAQSVADLLQGSAGVETATSGGPGQPQSVFLRGTNSSHVLVLIDGVKVGGATAGVTSFEHIPVDQIERIEIVRGPLSSLYGSEAIGGVIQIFTRHGGGPLTPYLSIGGGSYGTVEGNAGVSGGGDKGWYNLSVDGLNTDGFNACNAPGGIGGCYTVEPDRDGYHHISGSAQAGYRFDNDAEISAHFLRNEGRVAYDGSFSNQRDVVEQVAGGKVKYSPLTPWLITLQGGVSNDDSDDLLNGVFVDRFNTQRATASMQNDIALTPNHLLTLGFDYQLDEVTAIPAFAVSSRDDKGYFAEYQGVFLDRFSLQGSVRHDDNEQFGGHTTGAVAAGYAINNSLRLSASYGTAFKAPTFNDLYYPFFGNPALKPETSESYDVGLRGNHGWGRWTLDLYQTDIDQLIVFDNLTLLPVNFDTARIRGLDGMVGTQIFGWDARADLTLLDPVNLGPGANHGNQLPRRAKAQLRLDLDRGFGRFRVGASLLAASGRYDDPANSTRLGGYTTVDLRGEYRLSDSLRLQLRLANLFDRDYQTVAFYPQPGRSVFVTLSYRPAAKK